MTEPDELYTLRAQYWLGHYAMAMEEAKAVVRRPMSPALKLEREEFLLRSQLGLGQYDRVIADAQAAGDSNPGMCVLVQSGENVEGTDVVIGDIVEDICFICYHLLTTRTRTNLSPPDYGKQLLRLWDWPHSSTRLPPRKQNQQSRTSLRYCLLRRELRARNWSPPRYFWRLV